MSLLNELAKKPWLADQGPVAEFNTGKSFPLPSEKIGLRVFLTVVTVLFSLVIIVYSDRMALPDWRPLQEPWLLWLNTALLIVASVAFQGALVSARRGRIGGIRIGLQAAGVCTFAFLVGQIWVAQQLAAMGYYAETNIAVAFLYLMTGLHGLHLVGGLAVWGRTMLKMRRGDGVAELYLSVELCTIYWHYLLAIWLVLFGLLVLT